MENINKYLQLKLASYTGLLKDKYKFKYNEFGYRYIYTWEYGDNYILKNGKTVKSTPIKYDDEIYWPDIFSELNWMWGYWFKWGWLGKVIKKLLQDKPKHGE